MGLSTRLAVAFFAVFILCLVALVALAAPSKPLNALAGPAPQQVQQPAGPPEVHQLRPNVYWMTIPNILESNDGLIVGPTGAVLIDTSVSRDNEKLFLAEVAKITPKPIVAVILTHSDGDHIHGLPELPKGIEIIAQENCKDLMERSAAKGGRGGADPNFIPTKTYDKRLSLTLGGEKLELYHWAPAHTAGDTVIYLPKEKVAFAGDLLITVIPVPFFHMDEGGSPEGWIEEAKGMIALNADTFVAGHGPVADKAEVKKRLAAVEKERTETLKLIGEGKSLDQIHEALGETATLQYPGLPRLVVNYYSTYLYDEQAKK